jgi:hypothetical protein
MRTATGRIAAVIPALTNYQPSPADLIFLEGHASGYRRSQSSTFAAEDEHYAAVEHSYPFTRYGRLTDPVPCSTCPVFHQP